MKRPFKAERPPGDFAAVFKEGTDRDENEVFSVTETFAAPATGFVTTVVEVVIP
jgi:hypothetical protein